VPRGKPLRSMRIAPVFPFPTTFVLDGKGVIRTKMLGSPPTKFEKLQEVVDKALAS